MFPPKPFGQQPAFSAFGSTNTTTPFGQSSFAKPATGFSAPAFGTTSGTSLFGQNTQPAATGLFGAASKGTAFGQQPTQPGFSFSSPSSTGLFGQQPQQTTAPVTPGLFGASTSSAFGGATKPAFGFGAPSTAPTLFGQPQAQQVQTTSVFGQPATQSANTFSPLAGGFRSNAPQGTTVKYAPTVGTDSILKQGHATTVSTRHCCISTMKEYENKSLEELRYEDYLVNRKGRQQGTGVFGQAQPTASPFGAPSTSTATGGLFGSTTENKSLFGQSSAPIGFGAPSTGFGTTAPTSTLFGKPATGFGAPTTSTTTGFGFNAATPANPFGAANTQAKPFGVAAPQTNNLFGAPASQPSTGFGITPTTGFGSFGSQPNQSIGLFNQNKPTFSLGSSNSAFSFGQNTSTTTGSTLFGAKTTAPAFGAQTAFGAPATGTTAFSNSFGAPSTTQSTSLFTGTGFNKPATGFSFGPTPSSSAGLGLSLGQSTGMTSVSGIGMGQPSLFGSTAPKPGLFSGNSTFGSSGLGMNTGFGAGTSLGSGLNLGGNTMLGGGGLGGAPTNQTSQLAQQQLIAMALVPFGDSPLFRNLPPSTGRANEVLQPTNPAAQKAVLNSTAQYKVSPRSDSKIKVKVGYSSLMKKSLCEGLEEDDGSSSQTFQVRPNPKRLNITSMSTNRPTPESTVLPTGARESEKENVFPQSPASPAALSTSCDTEPANWLTKSKNRTKPTNPSSGRSSLNESGLSPEEPFTNNTILELRTQQQSPATQKDSGDQSTSSICVPSSSPRSDDKDGNSNKSSSSSDDSHELEDSAPQLLDAESHPTGIVCRRAGYYTIPSLDELTSYMNDDGSCIPDNFTVGRDGYGNVFFEDKFDVADLNLDDIVHFRHKEVVIYPDDNTKPATGQGLNRRAQVTLDRVWPMDKTKHSPIMDPDRLNQMDFETKLHHVCAKMGARFKEYRPQTGSWVFTVDHFSKYGLTDSDEEDAPPGVIKGTVGKGAPAKGDPLKQQSPKGTTVPGPVDLKKNASGFDTYVLEKSPMAKRFSSSYDSDMIAETVPQITSPMALLARESGTSSHKVQLMKSSFFMGGDEEDEDVDMNYLDSTSLPFSGLGGVGDGTEYSDGSEEEIARSAPVLSRHGLLRTQFALSEMSGQSIRVDVPPAVSSFEVTSAYQPSRRIASFHTAERALPVVDKPKTVILQRKGKINSRLIAGNCLADITLMRGASFKVGWGLGSVFFSLDNDFKLLSAGCKNHNLSKKTLCQEKLSSFKDSIKGHLMIQLECSASGFEGGCPIRAPLSGTDALLKHQKEAKNFANCENPLLNYHHQVWELCAALWGDLPELEIQGGNKGSNSHYTTMIRRKAVSEWLEGVSQPLVEQETALVFDSGDAMRPLSENYLDGILSLLSGRQILDACQKAQEFGDHYLALLLSQLSGSTAVRKLMCEQLDSWEKSRADAFIDPRRLRLYLLVAGLANYESSDGLFVNACHLLDWKRAFAVHLWYICSPIASLADAVQVYQEAFCASDEDSGNAYAKRPDPPYLDSLSDDCIETVHGRKVNDLCYHLLQLYCERSHQLEQLLNPATHTDDPKDYRLSWCLMQVLNSLDYSHISPLSEAIIHTGFASQLENYGLWEWAIFVLLFIKDNFARKSAVQDILGRHVELLENSKLSRGEEFLHQELHIPTEWIYQAKAIRASCEHRYGDQVLYLLKASEWNEAHQVIMEHLAADAIINERYVYLEELLRELEPAEKSSTICGWSNQGALLWDYLTVHKTMNELLKTLTSNPNSFRDADASYELEKIQPQLTRLCARINNLPCRNAKDRLCQCEIAKRACTLVRNVSQLQHGESAVWSDTLSQLIAQLPLPEDYTQQELHQVANACIT